MRTKLAACKGKVGFATWAQADKTARKMRRDSDDPLGPYRCPYCPKYHIGGMAVPLGRKLPRVVRTDDVQRDPD